MEAVNTTMNQSNEAVIKGLREALSEKDNQLNSVSEQLDSEKEKARKARQQTNKVREQLKEAQSEIEALKTEVEKAESVVVESDGSQGRIDKALFQLDTILQLNEGAEKISIDHLKLVVKTLTNQGSGSNLLLGN